jgi:hypothetical protein
MFIARKKCWAGFVRKWLLKNQPQEVAGFLPSVQSSLETMPQAAMAHAWQVGPVQPQLGMAFRTRHIHPTHLAGVRGWAESQVVSYHMHNIQVGARMGKLAVLQLVQSVGARSAPRGWAPTPSKFSPHNVECKKGER